MGGSQVLTRARFEPQFTCLEHRRRGPAPEGRCAGAEAPACTRLLSVASRSRAAAAVAAAAASLLVAGLSAQAPAVRGSTSRQAAKAGAPVSSASRGPGATSANVTTTASATKTASTATATGAAAPAKAPASTAQTRVLAALLERAVELSPGTYLSVGGAFEPLEDREPLLAQLDALRGADESIKAAVSLAGVVASPAVTRARIVALSAGAPQVVREVSGTSATGVLRSVDQLTLRPGEYELQAAAARARADGGVVASLSKTRLTVPDIWRGPLAVSPLILGDALAIAPRDATGRPFAFGPTAVRPAGDERFSRSGELHVAFRVFNWQAGAEEKPDLQVDYAFYERSPRGPHFFNKVKPQRLDGATLGERFDRASGVVNGGISIPLAAFPFGDFRLAVRVTDNRTKRTATQETHFTVVP